MSTTENTYLNPKRPPVFCPGCSHDRITQALDQAFVGLGLKANEIVIVSDIGCSGLFDTFFTTHAMHGLHGRALTYATGLKMARPELTVIVTMGDGGMGIGGAHLLSACRRNLDLTLLVLNNFNFGMTGGQYSATTPEDAAIGSGFLNRLEKPLDICKVAASAGAAYAARISSYRKDLHERIADAVRFEGFSVLDLWGICTGRYTRQNRITPTMIDDQIAELPPYEGPVGENARPEYGRRYREMAAEQPSASIPKGITPEFGTPDFERKEILILGGAGQRVVTAGEILCLAGMTAGLEVSQKSDYPITVLRGHSISEVVLSREPIEFTGIDAPDVVIAIGREGVERRRPAFGKLSAEARVIRAADVDIPVTDARVTTIDFKTMKVKSEDRALAALGVLAASGGPVTVEMLKAGLGHRFPPPVLEKVTALVASVAGNSELPTS